MTTLCALVCGFILDLILGDPYNWPHPIRAIGKLISFGDKKLRQEGKFKPKELKVRGAVLVLGVTMSVFLVSLMILKVSYGVSPVIGFIVESIMYYQILATKCLKDESMKVYHKLTQGTLQEAREQVAMIVGRDTMALDEKGIAKATIETVAENTSDGVIAPLLFCLLGGAPLGFWYKAVNTLDSMIGYKNDKYKDFGYTAARLDDIANFIPARLAAILMIIASALGGYNAPNALKIFKRDRFNHKSPNSAQTEAVCAGALGIQLAGDAYYFGQKVKKPTIGDSIQSVHSTHILHANKLLYITAVLALGIGVVIKAMLIL